MASNEHAEVDFNEKAKKSKVHVWCAMFDVFALFCNAYT